MKPIGIVVLLCCIVVSGSAWAQILPFGLTPRALGMGTAAVGVADDAGAWFENPAGLAALNVPVREGQQWGHDVLAAYGELPGTSAWGGSYSGFNPTKHIGVGVGGASIDDAMTLLGAGAGIGIGNTGLSVGLCVINLDPDVGSSHTLVDAGLMYLAPQPDKPPIRVGLRVTDLSDETHLGPFYNLGVAWPVTPDLLLAVDLVDLSDEIDMVINGGAEYRFGTAKEFALRAGFMDPPGPAIDSRLTLGAGYRVSNWHVDVGWISLPSDDIWSAGVGANF